MILLLSLLLVKKLDFLLDQQHLPCFNAFFGLFVDGCRLFSGIYSLQLMLFLLSLLLFPSLQQLSISLLYVFSLYSLKTSSLLLLSNFSFLLFPFFLIFRLFPLINLIFHFLLIFFLSSPLLLLLPLLSALCFLQMQHIQFCHFFLFLNVFVDNDQFLLFLHQFFPFNVFIHVLLYFFGSIKLKVPLKFFFYLEIIFR